MTPDEFLREYEAVTRDHDLERSLSMIDPDAVYWFSTGTSHRGLEEVAQALKTNFDAIEMEDYRLHDVTWLTRSNDVAACTYRFEWSGVIRGTPASGSGRGTAVLVRRGDSWAVVHEHLSRGEF